MLKNKQAWDDFYLSYARAAIIIAPDNCWHEIEKEELEKNAKSIVEQISHRRKGIFINCWYHSEYESEAMWKIYAADVKNAIAIQTTYGELKQQIGECATIKPVRYVDYSNQFIGPNEGYWYKRRSFEYEKEVRAVIHDLHSPFLRKILSHSLMKLKRLLVTRNNFGVMVKRNLTHRQKIKHLREELIQKISVIYILQKI